jgi:ubiquinone/menaquinone biosynthesis C-methylase UbiE
MKTRDYTAANLEAWQEVADLHREQNLAQLKVDFSRPGHSCLKEVDTTRLLALGVAGKDVAQICCNNGRELVSVKNLGAARCVGFDGAVGFIEQAREINDAANQDCEFVCCDIHGIDPAFNEAFDIIQITIGVIGWMPDLDAFFDAVARLIRPGGAVFIHEQHPILEMIEPGEADDPLSWDWSYFKPAPSTLSMSA